MMTKFPFPINQFVPPVWTQWPLDASQPPPDPVMFAAAMYANGVATWMLLMRRRIE